MRRTVCVVALTFAVAACSGSDAPTADDRPSVPSSSVSPTTDVPVRDAGDVEAPTTTVEDPEPAVWSVTIDVSVDGFGGPRIDATTSLAFDPDDAGDPFGVSASCSGLRDEVAAYSVFVSGGSTVDYVGLWTPDPLASAGVYDTQIRVEHDGATYDAFGTMTLGADLRSAEFVGFGPAGGEISGRYRCEGGSGPTPLVLGTADGTLESIDVFALLRRGTAVRVVGLATSELLLADCPAVESGEDDGDVAVVVRGGAAIGSITSFEAGAGLVTMRAGSVDYEFAEVTLTDADGAGAVSATAADGTVLDAAYRCT